MADWPLVGRGAELGRILDWIAGGAAGGAVIAGAAGVGKTRVGREALRAAELAGCAIEQVQATRPAAALPFGAFAHLLPAFDDSHSDHAEHWAALLQRCASGIRDRAAGRRLVLLVDDAHLLDDASAILTHTLVVEHAAFVLATIRSGDPAPDPIVSLWKDGLTERLDLGGLPADDVAQLLTEVLGGPVDPTIAVDLGLRCRGNALFLRELVVGALRDQSLRNVDGVWRLVAPLAPSDRLVELVEASLGVLTHEEAEVLELVSYAEPLGRLELEKLANLAAVESLGRKGLVSSDFSKRRVEIRLAHPVYGDVIRSRIPPLRLVAMARALAEVIEAAGGRRREDTLRIATWRLLAGGGAPDVLLAGARTARWHYDFSLAERLAQAAVEAGAGFDAELLAIQAASLTGADDDLGDHLAALAERAERDDQRCQVAQTQLDRAIATGNVQEARRIAAWANASIRDPDRRDEITARLAMVEHTVEGPAAGVAASVPLLERVSGKALVWAAVTASDGLARMGQFDAALAAAEQGDHAYRDLPYPLDWYPGVFQWLRCEVLTNSGSLIKAEQLARAQHQQALTERSPEAQAIFAWELSKVLRERGFVTASVALGQEALAGFRRLKRPVHERDCRATLAWAIALAGRPGEALGMLSDISVETEPPSAHRAVDLLLAQAWTAALSGDLRHARTIFAEAVATGERTGDLVGAADALHGIARLGEPRHAVTALAELAEQVEGVKVRAQLAHATALANADAAGLETVSVTFEDLGAQLLAAEASADAAAAWRTMGHRRAEAATFRASTLALGCEGASTPALRTIELRTPLTRAERDVALLAADRRSNKEIAAAVGISVRTVESHLQHTYEKLGISSREDLGRLIGGLPTG